MKNKWIQASLLVLITACHLCGNRVVMASDVWPGDESAYAEEQMGEMLEGEGMLTPPSENSSSDSSFVQQEEPIEEISWNEEWPYAQYSQIHTGAAVLYRAEDPNGITVAVNAGHGTAGGESVQTLCHPDGTPKVTGGSTAAGSTYATAVSSGTAMLDGTPEAVVNLQLAQILKEKLLSVGFNVLMIRDGDDVQLDNIARTVMSNQNADCHLALHYDSSTDDKGFYYTSVPDVASYRGMEPVASHWQQHNALGECLISGAGQAGVKVWGSGSMAIDLTQTSYSTIPSVDVECGDRGSDWSAASQERIADGIVTGLEMFFGVAE